MKIRTACLLIGVAAFIGVTGLSYGQAYLDRGLGDSGCVSQWEEMEVGQQLIGVSCGPGIGGRIAYFFPYSNDGVDSEIAYEGILSYMVSNVFATALSVGYTQPQFNEPLDGEAKITYANLTFELRGEPEPNFGLYLGFGPSIIFSSFDNDGGGDVKVDDTFGINVSIGIDYCITQNIVFNIDVKHIWFLEDYKYKVDDGSWEKTDLDSVVMGTGFKYFF